MQRIVTFVVVAAWLLLGAGAAAHIANQQTEFPDIGATQSADDIVLLTGLGVIPQTPVFDPDAPLTRQQLAAWAALAHRLADGGETPDVAALAQKALEAGLVSRLDGDADYAEIDAAILGGRIRPANGSDVPTKAEAAAWIAAHLDAKALALLGVSAGPTGVITDVKTGTSPDGDTSYVFVIGGKAYAVFDHARVVGPTDLTQWQGAAVTRSFLEPTDDGPALVFAQQGAAPAESTPSAPAKRAAGDSPLALIGGLIVAIALLIGLLFARRPRRG